MKLGTVSETRGLAAGSIDCIIRELQIRFPMMGQDQTKFRANFLKWWVITMSHREVQLTWTLFFFINRPTLASFLFIFGLFKQTIQLLQQINVKKNKCPYSIWHRYSNSWSFEHESSPITTKPGLPPLYPILNATMTAHCCHFSLGILRSCKLFIEASTFYSVQSLLFIFDRKVLFCFWGSNPNFLSTLSRYKNKFQYIITNVEIKHSDWMLQITWLV